MDALALVESPVQLLHVLEWRHRNPREGVHVVILAPRAAVDCAQLQAVRQIAVDADVTVEWLEPRAPKTALKTWRRLRRRAARAHRLVIGDPFSGLIQSVLPARGETAVTVVDDGTATIDFADLLRERRPLLRWATRPGPLARIVRAPLGARANHFYRTHPLHLFTVMPLDAPAEVHVEQHSYEWTRQHFGTPQIAGDLTVVGSSLAETGMLSEAAYFEAVLAEVAAAGGNGGHYIAHRREAPEKLDRIAEATGLEITRAELPLEIYLPRSAVGRQVICFPSSPAYTLPVLLQDAPISFRVINVDPAWIRPAAGEHAAAFLLKMNRLLHAEPTSDQA